MQMLPYDHDVIYGQSFTDITNHPFGGVGLQNLYYKFEGEMPKREGSLQFSWEFQKMGFF